MMMPPTIEVASLGFENSLILMVLALVVFGPRRLPGIGRQIGKLMYEVRKASNDFKFQMEEELRNAEEADRRKKEEEARNREQAPSLAANADSQVQNAEPGAPGAVESPYPDEAFYPAVNVADSQVSVAGPGSPEDGTYPQIHLPSTGEPVAAARPGRKTAQVKAPAAKKAVGTTKSEEKPVKSLTRAKKARKEPESNHA